MLGVLPAASTANALLRGLLGTSSPSAQPAAHAKGATEQSFATLLQQARKGAISSGLTVSVSPDAKVSLSSDQLTRLSAAADIAEANGASKAVVSIDGKMLVMDIASREIVGDVTKQAKGSEQIAMVLTDIDAFVRVPSVAQQTSTQPAQAGLLGKQGSVGNASVLALLADQSDASVT